MRVAVVGAGYVGKACAALLEASGHHVLMQPARDLLAAQNPTKQRPVRAVIFAHGKPVTVKRFEAAYDDLLASRVDPVDVALRHRLAAPDSYAVLISSTVACLPSAAGARDLPVLQRAYEAAFLDRFPAGSILRLGAMRGPNWQIDQGLEPLKKSLLLKRLRMAGVTDIPWADDALLARALAEAIGTSRPVRKVVAYPTGFDVNPLLDAGLGPMTVRVRIPDAWFRGAYESLGAPPAFLTITTADVLASGWSQIGSET